MMVLLTMIQVIFTLILLVKKASIRVWIISYIIISLLITKYSFGAYISAACSWIFLLILVVAAIKPIRMVLFTNFIFKIVSRSVPKMSRTEREALEAGTVSWEGELFCGSPDFVSFNSHEPIKLTKEENEFITHKVGDLCRMLNDWDVTQVRADLPKAAWDYIKNNGFLGMIIPKEYGGLGFSTTAQMQVLVKLYSHSVTAATTVAVPNSLGPAELLLKYGTIEQKNYYLPRLARGEEIPCFALTGPNAGSDAASIPDFGIVCEKKIGDKKVLGMSLTWNKRYITLCPVATIIGLAFRLYDPKNLLGKGEDLGISCVLIPADTKGVVKGRRHFPLNVAFMNGPTQGHEVFVPLDNLIGGVEMAGFGWKMLMECLGAGRAISLPSGACGAAKATTLATSAYAKIRTQFHQPLANFEGIEEPLARIVGNTYIIDATLTMIAADIDRGARPPVASAIVKLNTTELSRQIAIDAMDIHGGKGICLGPNNYLARGFQSSPIAITVEGANILSRTLIIFGQGAIRCHPYAFSEMETVRTKDINKFDEVLRGHIQFFLSNFLRTIGYAFTDAKFIKFPKSNFKRYYQLITFYSVSLAFFSDLAMFLLGGKLKRMEKLSARFGDVLSNLYMASAVLKKYINDGSNLDDSPIVEWCLKKLFSDCQSAINGIIVNFPIKFIRPLLRVIFLPYGYIRHKPSDKLGSELAKIITMPSATRDRVTSNVFHEDIANSPIGRVEAAFKKVYGAYDIEHKINKAVKDKQLKSLTLALQIEEAKNLGIISGDEYLKIKDAEISRQYVIAVDDFDFKYFDTSN
jgi:acyl-CoA dehydrogenase